MARAQHTPSPYSCASSTTIRAYDGVRPKYPREIVERIWQYLQLGGRLSGCEFAQIGEESQSGEIQAIDMGAGTGIFTGQLLEFSPNIRVSAVEPAENMRWRLANNYESEVQAGRLQIVDALAEHTELEASSADLVVFAQSFHWMNQDQVLAEAARLLRPGGLLAVAANQMDVSIAWVHRLTRIMRSGDVLSPEKGPQFGKYSGDFSDYSVGCSAKYFSRNFSSCPSAHSSRRVSVAKQVSDEVSSTNQSFIHDRSSVFNQSSNHEVGSVRNQVFGHGVVSTADQPFEHMSNCVEGHAQFGWQPLPFFEVSWTQELSVDQVLELGRTRSSYLRQTVAGQAKMQANLRWYLLEHLGFCQLDTVRIPYRTFLWSAICLPT